MGLPIGTLWVGSLRLWRVLVADGGRGKVAAAFNEQIKHAIAVGLAFLGQTNDKKRLWWLRMYAHALKIAAAILMISDDNGQFRILKTCWKVETASWAQK